MLLDDAIKEDSALAGESFRVRLVWKCSYCGTLCRSTLDNYCSHCGRVLTKPKCEELDNLANAAGTHIEGSHVVKFFMRYINDILRPTINRKVEKGE